MGWVLKELRLFVLSVFSATQGTFSRVNHMVRHKTSLSEFKIKIMPSIFLLPLLCHVACGILVSRPDQEWNLCPLQWNQGILATRPPWKSHTKYFLDHSGTKLEINNTRKTGDYTWWKPNSTLLNNQKKSKEKSKNASEQMKIETQFTRTYGLLQKLF